MNRLKVARRTLTMSVILWSALGASFLGAKETSGAKAQLGFGVDMAKRGLWSEALFRFEQARLLDPASVSILNNLAICYEAGGRFEEALAAYREALRLAPENKVLKQNYSRFAEFYQGYRPRKPAAPVTEPAPVAPAPVEEGAAGSSAPPTPPAASAADTPAAEVPPAPPAEAPPVSPPPASPAAAPVTGGGM